MTVELSEAQVSVLYSLLNKVNDQGVHALSIMHSVFKKLEQSNPEKLKVMSWTLDPTKDVEVNTLYLA